MDLKFLFILMLILYLLPELFRRRRPKKYEYPETPKRQEEADVPVNQPDAQVFENPSFAAVNYEITEIENTGTHFVSQLPAPVREESSWLKGFDNRMIVNGFIFSEILQPPRALRPLRPVRRR